MTLKHSTQLNLLEPILFAEASLASRGRSQTLSEEAQKMTAISGRKCSELLKLLGHGSLLEKMCEALLMSRWGSSVASLTWKILATKTKLSLFQLSPSMPNTGETDASLLVWPTPRVSDTEGGIVKNVEYQNGSFSRRNKQGVRWGVKLKDAVSHAQKLWPTPTGQDNPQVRGEGKTVGTKRGTTLGGAVRLWPTPMAHEARLGYQDRTRGKKGIQESLTTVVINKAGGRKATDGQMNPTFPEYLMGYPIGWTDLNVSGTASSLLSQCTLDEPSSRPADD